MFSNQTNIKGSIGGGRMDIKLLCDAEEDKIRPDVEIENCVFKYKFFRDFSTVEF